jgi:hypothetical protein
MLFSFQKSDVSFPVDKWNTCIRAPVFLAGNSTALELLYNKLPHYVHDGMLMEWSFRINIEVGKVRLYGFLHPFRSVAHENAQRHRQLSVTVVCMVKQSPSD